MADGAAQKYWYRGLPYGGVHSGASTPGAEKHWVLGLPIQWLTTPNIQTYNQSAQGSTSPLASLLHQTGKALQAASSPVGSLTALRVVLWSIQATATAATSLIFATTKIAQATASTVQSIATAIAASRTASTAPGSTATKQTAHATSGQVSPTAARSSATGKGAQAVTTPTTGLSNAIAIIRRVSASLAASSTKAGGKALQATTTPTKALVRQTGATRQASTSPIARLVQALNKAAQATASVIATNPISRTLAIQATGLVTAIFSKLRVFIGKSAGTSITITGQSAGQSTGWVGKTSASSISVTGKSAAD